MQLKCSMCTSLFVTEHFKRCTQEQRFNRMNVYCFIRDISKWNWLSFPSASHQHEDQSGQPCPGWCSGTAVWPPSLEPLPISMSVNRVTEINNIFVLLWKYFWSRWPQKGSGTPGVTVPALFYFHHESPASISLEKTGALFMWGAHELPKKSSWIQSFR